MGSEMCIRDSYQADIAPMNRDLPKEATDDGAVVVALAVPQA